MPRLVPLPDRRTIANAPRVTTELDLDRAWHLYDRQARFVRSDALFSLFLGGVGSGKSVALTARVLRMALANPGAVGALLGRTGNDLATVLLPSLFDQLQEAQDECGVSLIKDYDKGNAKLRLVNNCTIYFRPYNRIAKLRGLTLTFAGADEIEWSEADPEEVWTTLVGRLRGPGPLPGLAFSTSPNGLRGITKRFVDAQRLYLDAKNRGDVAAMRIHGQFHVTTATSFANPHLPPHFFESLRSMGKRRYDQEVKGKVLRPQHSILTLEARHLIPWDWRQHPNLPRVYGVDWGGQNHHYACMFQVEPSGRWICCDELARDDLPRGKFEGELYAWIDGHGQQPPVMFGVDKAGFIENGNLQRRYRHSRVEWMDSADTILVSNGIEMLRDALDPRDDYPRLVFSDRLAQTFTGLTAPVLPAIRNYVYWLDAAGVPTTKPKKDNINDHAPDAVRYAWVGSAARRELHAGQSLWVPSTQAARPAAAVTVGNSGQQV